MKTVIELAREAGILEPIDLLDSNQWRQDTIRELERFAELIRADERNSWPAQQVLTPLSQALEDVWAEPDEVSLPAQQEPVAWPIETNDQVEALAKQCDWNNRRYMTPADYQIWCDQMRQFVQLASPPAQQEPVRIYDYVWPQRDEHKEECVYACSYTPGHHLAHGELLAVVHPSQLKNAYLQRDDEAAHNIKENT